MKRVARLTIIMLALATAVALVSTPEANALKKEKSTDYSFTFYNLDTGQTQVVAGTAEKNDVTMLGMTVHVSCSDQFTGGTGDKGGPAAGSPWRVVSFSIQKYEDGNLKKECGGGWTPPTTTTTTTTTVPPTTTTTTPPSTTTTRPPSTTTTVPATTTTRPRTTTTTTQPGSTTTTTVPECGPICVPPTPSCEATTTSYTFTFSFTVTVTEHCNECANE